MRKPETILREYASRQSDDSLRYLLTRLNNRLGSDMAEVLDSFSKNGEVDHLFRSAKTASELYDLIDLAQEHLSREYNRRPEAAYR